MQEGVLGLILLWGLVFGSIAYGSTKEAIKESALVQYNHLLQMLFFISFVFFIWAIFNTASNQSLDLGVISLGAVFVTTGIGLCHAPYGTSADGSRTDAFFVAIACALVAGNYVYAIIEVPSPTAFVLYAWSGLLIWLCFGLAVIVLLIKTTLPSARQHMPSGQYGSHVAYTKLPHQPQKPETGTEEA